MVLRAEKQSLLQPGSGRWERGEGREEGGEGGEDEDEDEDDVDVFRKKDFRKEMEKQNKKIYILKANGTEIGF